MELSHLRLEEGFVSSVILDAVQDAIVTVDPDGSIVYLNALAIQRYNLDPNTVYGQSYRTACPMLWFATPEEEAAAMADLRTHGRWRSRSRTVRHQENTCHIVTWVSLLYDKNHERDRHDGPDSRCKRA